MKRAVLAMLAALLCLGAAAQTGAREDSFDYDIRELRNSIAPDFSYEYGNWIQYFSGAAVWGLKACGVPSRSDWGQMAVAHAGGAVASLILDHGPKWVIDRMRPDGSRANSFPSGHTTTAFLTATWLQKEYGDRLPWLCGIGYGVATLTAQHRILRNKHWATDTMAGAVFGVAAAELGYWLSDIILGRHDYRLFEEFSYDATLEYWDVYYWFGRKVGLGNDGHGSSVNLQLQAPLTPEWSLAVRGTAEYIGDFYGDAAAYSVLAGGNWSFLQRGRFGMDAHALAGAAFRSGSTGLDLAAGLSADYALTGIGKVRALAEWEGLSYLHAGTGRSRWMNSINLGLGGVIYF